MKFCIGTQNEKKVLVAKKVISNLLPEVQFTLKGVEVDSGVSETPHDQETMQGAHNRSVKLIELDDCEYGIGLESGLVERYGQIYEEAWCCVAFKDSKFFGYSSGLKVPDLITNKMKQEGLKHYQVMRQIKHLLPVKDKKDTWGNYTDLMLTREISFEEALRNALVQAFVPEKSLYRM